MNSAQEQAIQLLRLPADRFAGEEYSDLADQLAPDDDAIEEGTVEPILALGIPETVDLERFDRIPALLAKRWAGLRSWEVDIEQNLTWILVDLQTGDVKAVCPLPLDKRRMVTPLPSRTPPEPDSINRAAITYGVEPMTLPAVFGRDWPADRYAATLVVYDWKSNTATFAVRHDVPRVIDLRATPSPFVESTEIDGLLDTPPIDFSVSRADDGSLSVSGRISVLRDPAVLVNSSDDERTVLPAALVFLQLDSTTPFTIEMKLPVELVGENVESAFTAAIHEFGSEEEPSGVFAVFLALGEIVSGPVMINLDRLT